MQVDGEIEKVLSHKIRLLPMIEVNAGKIAVAVKKVKLECCELSKNCKNAGIKLFLESGLNDSS